MYKKNLFLFFLSCWTAYASAQPHSEISLLEAYDSLEANYAVLQNAALHEQIYQQEIKLLDISQLPSLTWKADGRLQSERPQLEPEGNIPLPFSIDLPLYSFSTYAEGQYTLLDGGIHEARSQLQRVQLRAKQQEIAVTRFSLRERINHLFLHISLLQEQAKLLDLSLANLQVRKDQVAAGVDNGIFLESELAKLRVRELEIEAQQNELEFQRSGLIRSLEQLTRISLSAEVQLSYPAFPDALTVPELNRPEQTLFQLKREAILAQSELVESERRPKLAAFAQAGIGYPNPLNFFDNGVAPFGVIGLNFAWTITDWKKEEIQKQILTLQAQQLQNEQASFEFNLNTQTGNYLTNVSRIRAQIKRDEQIANLQAQILDQNAAQLDEGVITTSEYIQQLNAELKARQQLVIHRTELLKIQLEFWNQRGGIQYE